MPTSATLGELCALVGGTLHGGSPDTVIVGVSSVAAAGPDQISWVAEPRYSRALSGCRAAAVIVPRSLDTGGVAAILCDDPEWAISLVLRRMARPNERPAPGVHTTAVIAPDTRIDERVCVGAYTRIGSATRVGPGCVIHAGVHIASNCRVGCDCEIFPNVYIGDYCELGDRVVIKPNAVIGSEGFGFAFREGRHQRLAQIGIVILEDDVEIGANSCVDRAKFGATVIGRGTKIDNLVQVAHNCTTGPHCILAGQVGLSGSVHLGTGVIMGGRSGSSHGITIADGVRMGASCIATKDLTAAGDYAGTPARPHVEHNRAMAATRRMPELVLELKELRRCVSELEARVHALTGVD